MTDLIEFGGLKTESVKDSAWLLDLTGLLCW